MNLEKKLRRDNERRIAWLDRIEAMPPEQLTARPRPGKWSILEIIDHLVVAERLVFQDLPDPSLLAERPRRLKHRFFHLLVVFFLRSGLPVQMPSPALAPQGGRSLSELRRLWDESQEWLIAYVSQLDAKGLRRAVFRHPAAGPITVRQVVALNQVHIDRHIRQAEALRRLLS